LNNIKHLRYSFALALVLLAASGGTLSATPEAVKFPSRDGTTELVGYLFKPASAGPHAAIVMLHGRGGPYSSSRPGMMSADNLTQRHRFWGEYWAARGYVALHVDSFGPRGYARGFAKHTYSTRPAAVSEQTVRPLDAYGALDYLRSRNDVIVDRIGLQGWSNGGMTLLSAMAPDPPRIAITVTDRARLAPPMPETDFRAAIALYPSCRTQIKQPGYRPYAPLLITVGSDDDEVSPTVCREFAELQRKHGAAIELVWYDGAHHAYDDPGKTKQSHTPNKAAMEDTLRRAEVFFRNHLQPGG
jgi:dienelactone hydrolase